MTDGHQQRPFFIRNLNAGRLLENFLISAVASLLAVRFYLGLTGFPQIGGRGLHIAHMLWGGLLMLIALFMLLAYLGHRVRRTAAVIGGIGFGLFIDEVGKFITSDNNYFYRPAIAVIYAVFVLIFIWWRAFERRRETNEETYVANSLMLLQDAALHDLDANERFQLENWVRRSGRTGNNLLGESEVDLIERCPPPIPPGPLSRRLRPIGKRARSFVHLRWAGRIAIGILLLRSAGAIVVSLGLLFAKETTGPGESIDLPLLISSGVSGTLALVGLIYLLRHDRLRALRWFSRSILASIFLTDLFTFYYQQFGALGDLTADLILLFVIENLLEAESRRSSPPVVPQAA